MMDGTSEQFQMFNIRFVTEKGFDHSWSFDNIDSFVFIFLPA